MESESEEEKDKSYDDVEKYIGSLMEQWNKPKPKDGAVVDQEAEAYSSIEGNNVTKNENRRNSKDFERMEDMDWLVSSTASSDKYPRLIVSPKTTLAHVNTDDRLVSNDQHLDNTHVQVIQCVNRNTSALVPLSSTVPPARECVTLISSIPKTPVMSTLDNPHTNSGILTQDNYESKVVNSMSLNNTSNMPGARNTDDSNATGNTKSSSQEPLYYHLFPSTKQNASNKVWRLERPTYMTPSSRVQGLSNAIRATETGSTSGQIVTSTAVYSMGQDIRNSQSPMFNFPLQRNENGCYQSSTQRRQPTGSLQKDHLPVLNGIDSGLLSKKSLQHQMEMHIFSCRKTDPMRPAIEYWHYKPDTATIKALRPRATIRLSNNHRIAIPARVSVPGSFTTNGQFPVPSSVLTAVSTQQISSTPKTPLSSSMLRYPPPPIPQTNVRGPNIQNQRMLQQSSYPLDPRSQVHSRLILVPPSSRPALPFRYLQQPYMVQMPSVGMWPGHPPVMNARFPPPPARFQPVNDSGQFPCPPPQAIHRQFSQNSSKPSEKTFHAVLAAHRTSRLESSTHTHELTSIDTKAIPSTTNAPLLAASNTFTCQHLSLNSNENGGNTETRNSLAGHVCNGIISTDTLASTVYTHPLETECCIGSKMYEPQPVSINKRVAITTSAQTPNHHKHDGSSLKAKQMELKSATKFEALATENLFLDPNQHCILSGYGAGKKCPTRKIQVITTMQNTWQGYDYKVDSNRIYTNHPTHVIQHRHKYQIDQPLKVPVSWCTATNVIPCQATTGTITSQNSNLGNDTRLKLIPSSDGKRSMGVPESQSQENTATTKPRKHFIRLSKSESDLRRAACDKSQPSENVFTSLKNSNRVPTGSRPQSSLDFIPRKFSSITSLSDILKTVGLHPVYTNGEYYHHAASRHAVLYAMNQNGDNNVAVGITRAPTLQLPWKHSPPHRASRTLSKSRSTLTRAAGPASFFQFVEHERLGLHRIPYITTSINQNESSYVLLDDVRECLFPKCTHPKCDIVLTALQLLLGVILNPSVIPQCSQYERMEFANKFQLAALRCDLVRVDSINRNLAALLHTVMQKHKNSLHRYSQRCKYASKRVCSIRTKAFEPIAYDGVHDIIIATCECLKKKFVALTKMVDVAQMKTYVPVYVIAHASPVIQPILQKLCKMYVEHGEDGVLAIADVELTGFPNRDVSKAYMWKWITTARPKLPKDESWSYITSRSILINLDQFEDMWKHLDMIYKRMERPALLSKAVEIFLCDLACLEVAYYDCGRSDDMSPGAADDSAAGVSYAFSFLKSKMHTFPDNTKASRKLRNTKPRRKSTQSKSKKSDGSFYEIVPVNRTPTGKSLKLKIHRTRKRARTNSGNTSKKRGRTSSYRNGVSRPVQSNWRKHLDDKKQLEKSLEENEVLSVTSPGKETRRSKMLCNYRLQTTAQGKRHTQQQNNRSCQAPVTTTEYIAARKVDRKKPCSQDLEYYLDDFDDGSTTVDCLDHADTDEADFHPTSPMTSRSASKDMDPYDGSKGMEELVNRINEVATANPFQQSLEDLKNVNRYSKIIDDCEATQTTKNVESRANVIHAKDYARPQSHATNVEDHPSVHASASTESAAQTEDMNKRLLYSSNSALKSYKIPFVSRSRNSCNEGDAWSSGQHGSDPTGSSEDEDTMRKWQHKKKQSVSTELCNHGDRFAHCLDIWDHDAREILVTELGHDLPTKPNDTVNKNSSNSLASFARVLATSAKENQKIRPLSNNKLVVWGANAKNIFSDKNISTMAATRYDRHKSKQPAPMFGIALRNPAIPADKLSVKEKVPPRIISTHNNAYTDGECVGKNHKVQDLDKNKTSKHLKQTSKKQKTPKKIGASPNNGLLKYKKRSTHSDPIEINNMCNKENESQTCELVDGVSDEMIVLPPSDSE